MRKTVSLFSLFALFALPALADGPVTAEVTTGAVLDQAVAAVELPLFLDDAASATPAIGGDCAAGVEDALFLAIAPPPPWPCPYGAPHCTQHDDCDKYCGDPQFGWCFFSTGCCGCSG